jgi:hypothetical protein
MHTCVTPVASASGNNYGLSNTGSSPIMTNVTASASTTGSSGSTTGVLNIDGAPILTNVTATAIRSGIDTYGVLNDGGTAKLIGVTAPGTGGDNAHDVSNNGTSTPEIRGSSLRAHCLVPNVPRRLTHVPDAARRCRRVAGRDLRSGAVAD